MRLTLGVAILTFDAKLLRYACGLTRVLAGRRIKVHRGAPSGAPGVTNSWPALGLIDEGKNETESGYVESELWR